MRQTIATTLLLSAFAAAPAAGQMVAKPTTARGGTATGSATKPLATKAGTGKSQPISAAVASATITITQPVNNGDTLRVSTGGEYRRCGFAPGTQVPQPVSGPVGMAAGVAIASVQNVCTITVPKGGSVPLQIIYDKYSLVPVAGNGWQLSSTQWGGACAGTSGDTCILDMAQDQAVKTDTAAPGGIQRPMGQTEE